MVRSIEYFLFIKKDELNNYKNFLSENTQTYSYNIIHPDMFTGKIQELTNPENYSLKKLFLKLPQILWNKLLHKFEF